MLDGGIKLSKLTEVAGIAGVGKTQLWYVFTNLIIFFKFIKLNIQVQLTAMCYGSNAKGVQWKSGPGNLY